jgi:hypothetical protein
MTMKTTHVLIIAVAALAVGQLLTHKSMPDIAAAVASTPAPAPITQPLVVAQAAPPVAVHATLQQQAECKAVAEKYGASWWNDHGKMWYGDPYGAGEHDIYNVVSHMNAKLGVCFALIHLEGSYDDGKIHNPHRGYMLVDAVADRVYADYDWKNDTKDKKYWDVKPTTCWSSAGDGSQNYCESEDEFFKAINSHTTD